jgi:glutamyl-tRNA reductase
LASAEAGAKQRHEADIVELREAQQRIRDMRRRIKASENARQILEAEGKELLSWIQRLQHEFVSSGRAS